MSVVARTLISDRNDQLLRNAVFLTGLGVSVCVMLLGSGNLSIKLLALGLLSFFSAASVRFELTHPLVWFNLGFLMYAAAGPVLFLLDFHPYPSWSGWKIMEHLDFDAATNLHFIALLVVLAVIGPVRVNMAPVRFLRAQSYAEGAMPMLILAGLLAGLSIIELMGGQFRDKSEMVREGSHLIYFSFGFNVAVVALSAVMYRVLQQGNLKVILIVVPLTLVACLAVIALAGHRNVLFRFLLMFLFLHHTAYRRISMGTLALIAVAALASIGFLGGLKMAFFADQDLDLSLVLGYRALLHNPISIIDSDLLLAFKLFLSVSLGNEFMTASNNLALITSIVPDVVPFQGLTGFLMDVGRALLPGVFFQGVVQNTALVYNAAAFPDVAFSGGGVGFSMVGAGYMYGGTLGVVLLFIAIGWAIRFLYVKSARSPFWYLTYINSIAILIYSVRSDVSGPLSQIPKHVMLPLGLMLFISYLMRTRKRSPADPADVVGIGADRR